MTSSTPPPAPAVSRAAVVRGLAWTTPAVAAVAVAPLAAASPWVGYSVTFTSSTNRTNATGRGTATGAQPGAPVDTIRVTSSVDSPRTHLAGNLTAFGSGAGLTLSSQVDSHTAPQTFTLTFPHPVRDLSLTIGDITSNSNQGVKGYVDDVYVTPAPKTVTRTSVTGDATATSPLVAVGDGVTGSATVTWAGPLTSVTVVLLNSGGRGEQMITVSNVKYSGDLRKY